MSKNQSVQAVKGKEVKAEGNESLTTPEGIQITLDEAIESNSVLSAENDRLNKELSEAKAYIETYIETIEGTDDSPMEIIDSYKAELEESVAQVKLLSSEVESLKEKLSISERKGAVSSSGVIMDKKDLIKGKSYVTGPCGIGFVEVK